MQKTRNGARRSRNLWPKNAHADTLGPALIIICLQMRHIQLAIILKNTTEATEEFCQLVHEKGITLGMFKKFSLDFHKSIVQ